MTATTGNRRELKNIGYELFIGCLSILSIFNLVMFYVFKSDPNVQIVLGIMNSIMMPIFLGDFIYRFVTAPSRSQYFWRRFGWADLISSIPLPQVKILRMFRLWRVIRLFIEFGARNLIHQFITQRAQNALLTVVFLVICVLEFGSIAVLMAESTSSNANITTASDAIWWAYVTITTVGYGDKYPVTNWGRIVGIFVMTAGVGLFGTLSGFLANSFLSPRKNDDKSAEAAIATIDPNDPKAKLEELKQLVLVQEQGAAEIKAKLAEIEALL